MRDAMPFSGVAQCITCGAYRHYTGGDCGHGIGRQHKGTKYDERNNHFQCKTCNGFNGGMREVYEREVDKRYGPGTWNKLLIQSRQVVKWSQFEVDAMAEHYRKLAEQIKREKNL